ncbi:MAG TPA: CHAD domain-containing protein [Armatimonadota bacterium]|nr:CHAD domain-containing protein [Armatimonadota bacterium]
MASTRDAIPKPSERYRDALRGALEYRYAAVLSFRDDAKRFAPDGGPDCPMATRTEVEIEAVHEMRVWAKRTREMLRMLRDCGVRGGVRKALRAIDQANDALGPVREADVTLCRIQAEAAVAPESERPGLEWLIAELQAQLRDQFPLMRDALESLEREGIDDKIARVVRG